MKIKIVYLGISLFAILGITLSCASCKETACCTQSKDSPLKKKEKDQAQIWYGVITPKNNTIIKEKIADVKKLNDFMNYYPENWIVEYDSMNITRIEGDKKVIYKGKNNVLTAEQIAMLNSLEYSEDFEVNVFYKEKNVVTKKLETGRIRRSYTIIPIHQASYAAGKDSLIHYFRKNSEDFIDLSKVGSIKIGRDSIETQGPTAILFEINKEGKPENIRIETSSNDKETDELLLRLVADMPPWNPARDSQNKLVNQEFHLIVTLSTFGWGC